MVIKSLIKQGIYQDSVGLMRLSKQVCSIEGIINASVMMGTPQNKNVLLDAGLYDDLVADANPSQMVIVVKAETDEIANEALLFVEKELAGDKQPKFGSKENEEAKYNSLNSGIDALEGANFAVISVPGPYAAAEALKALKKGLNVFLFSDNVDLSDEIELKKIAHERGLLLMGPDCGTAFINGVPLGFSHAVAKGNIGIVGASGTGTQEVMTLIDRWGEGVSQVFGTGGRDLYEEIGGITMLDSLRILKDDPDTKVIVIISKTLAPTVADVIYNEVQKYPKPIVVCFLGTAATCHKENVFFAGTLEETAHIALELNKGNIPQLSSQEVTCTNRVPVVENVFLRGLFSGGSLAEEALTIISSKLNPVYANLKGWPKLSDPNVSQLHSIIDMGSDEFTIGRPHPMIDFSYRITRLKEEAKDSKVGVILLDVVLGYGANPDPAGELVPIIREVQERNKDIEIVLSVVGTDKDPQSYAKQVLQFKASGAHVAKTNAQAAKIAAEIILEKSKMSEVNTHG